MQNLGTSGEIQTLISHTSMQKEWLTLQTSISTSNGHQTFLCEKNANTIRIFKIHCWLGFLKFLFFIKTHPTNLDIILFFKLPPSFGLFPWLIVLPLSFSE